MTTCPSGTCILVCPPETSRGIKLNLPESLRSYVQLDGTGTLPVVLGHGFGTDRSAWDALLRCLPEDLAYIRYDLAGAGSDTDTAHRYRADYHSTLFAYADDLIQLLDTLELQSVTYIGHSMSCMIGAIAAVARPDLFARLILIGASPHYLKKPDYPGELQPTDLDTLYTAMATNYQAWAAGFAPQIFGLEDAALLTDYAKTLFRLQPDIALRTLQMIFHSDLRRLVENIRQPVHLINSRQDFAVPEGVALWLHEHISGSTLDWIEAPGHLPHVTSAPDVCLAICSYLPIEIY